MKTTILFFLLSMVLGFIPSAFSSTGFETNITNLNNEVEEEIMRMKSVGCLYLVNLRYDYNKEMVEITLKQSPHEDKNKLYDKLLFGRLKYCMSQISQENASFIAFNLNNDKTLNDANLYYLIEPGTKEDELLLDPDIDLELDAEELAIQQYIMNDLEFSKDELIKEEAPEMISRDEQKKRAEEEFQKRIDKMNEDEIKQEPVNKQEKPLEEKNEFLEEIKLQIKLIMKNENFNIYCGLALGILTGIVYAIFSKKGKQEDQKDKPSQKAKKTEKQESKEEKTDKQKEKTKKQKKKQN